MSVKSCLIGGVGLLAAVSGASFIVPQFIGANPVVLTVVSEAAPVVVAQAPGTAKAVPAPVIRRPRESTPAPFNDPGFFAPSGEAAPGLSLPDPLDPFGEPQPAAPDVPTVEMPVDAAVVDPAPLRRELRQLLDEKSELLTVPQLQAAIIRTEREIRELRAQDRLEQLRHELDKLSRDYPQTWGGTAAQKLFNVPLPSTGPTPTERLDSFDPAFGPHPDFVHPSSAPKAIPRQRS